MNEANVRILARALGTHNPRRTSKEWIKMSCPFATWTHRGATDNDPSFGISIKSVGQSRFNCLGCRRKGALIPMLWAIQENTGEDMTEMARFVLKHDLPSQEDLDSLDESSDPLEALANRLQSIHYSYSKPGSEKDVECEDTGVFSDRELPVKFISEEDFAPLKNLSPEAQYYLLSSSRGLTSNSIIEWELGWQPFVKRIVIPIRDSEKRLVGLSGRTIIDEEPKYLHSPGFKRDYVLYGEHRIIPGDTCYVVEGFFDVIRLYQLGYRNVLGIMGTYISNQQRYKILKHFKQVKIFLDGDLAGKTGANSIYKALHAKISCEIVEPPVDKDPADLDRTVLTSLLGPPTFSD